MRHLITLFLLGAVVGLALAAADVLPTACVP
jgi:hypothetical protein